MTTTAQTTEFRATTAPARAGFAVLAMVITLTLLAGVGQVADQQFDQAQMAQTATATQVAQTSTAARG